jgi:hypothetical protein
VLVWRGLLIGTIEEILAKAEAHPDRQIVIGTPKTADEPVMVRLKKNEKFKK